MCCKLLFMCCMHGYISVHWVLTALTSCWPPGIDLLIGHGEIGLEAYLTGKLTLADLDPEIHRGEIRLISRALMIRTSESYARRRTC